MMRRFPSSKQGLFLVLLPLFILSACSLGGGSAGLAKTPTTKGALNATPTVSIRLGVQACPDAVKASDHWTNLINLASTQKIESVICAYLMGVPTLQAVLKIRASGNERPLDLAVFTNLTSAKPEQIFSLKGLEYGEASISNYNTLLTMQIDLGAKQNQVQHDIYREFKWSDSAKTLGQVNFVGLYPDMTRYQAEYEQDQINNGKGTQQWRLSAITTSQNFAEFDLGWPHASSAKVISGGGTHDANAVVQVKNP
ncbi:MAG TPA: hypothetical protein VFN35_28190, partial [Ktedonobacteraceae bacterium]|nr:hypothetical protein [Ktedonobacteraceae bacterium]